MTANQASVNDTAGQTVTADSAVTVTSFDTDVTGAVVTISGNAQAGDTLHFTNTANITGTYSSGTLTLTGTDTRANYQTALQSITYSSTSTSTLARTVSFVVDDSASSPTTSNTATTTINVSAPVTITGAWVKNPTWGSSGTTNFFGYLATHSLGSSTLGFALQTGAQQSAPAAAPCQHQYDLRFIQRAGQQHRPGLAEAGRWHRVGVRRGSCGDGLLVPRR